MKKKTYFFCILCLLTVCGSIIGFYTTAYSSKCLEINSNRDVFYLILANKLKKGMQEIGYNLNCPDIFSKTVIDFHYTSKNLFSKKYKQRPSDVNIALIGGCSMGFDIEALKDYDFVLPVIKNRTGYLSMFNLMAVHFPLLQEEYSLYCDVEYNDNEIDIKKLIKNLDDIIKRARK